MHTTQMRNSVVIYQPISVRDDTVVGDLCTVAGGATVAFQEGRWVNGQGATVIEPVSVITSWWPDDKRDAVEAVVAREVRRMLDAGELTVMVEWLRPGYARADLHSLETPQ